MSISQKKSGFGSALYFALMACLAVYFTFAAVQGDYGLFRRVQIKSEASELKTSLQNLEGQVSVLENKTKRLSDDYLDLDLLDEQARSILGMLRTDELVIR